LSAVAPTLLPSGPRPLPAEATRLLYERHSGRIFGYCLSLLGSREEAEDAVQTTFMNAQRGLDRGVVPQFELAWLFKIARNVCYNRSESCSRRRRVESVHDLDSLQEVLATPERTATLSIGELTRAVGAIPERQRRALLLREFQGMSYEEIAGELGVSVAAVETLLFRARRSVADQLEQTSVPHRRGAVASVVALFRWFFDGSAVPLKLAAVTAAVATTATLAVAPAIRSAGNEPVHVIPTVLTTGARTKSPTPVRTVGHPNRQAPAPSVRVHADRTALPATVAQAGGASGGAPAGRPPVHPQGQQVADASSPTPSVPSPMSTSPSLTTLPTVQDVTEVLPVTVPDIPQPVQLPDVDLPVDVPQIPELPKLP
jgi:RNA polymerase sigma-70 factor, ECF subfamily